MHRSQALTVVKATARLKVLAAHAREHLAAAAAFEAENGVTSDVEGGAGRRHCEQRRQQTHHPPTCLTAVGLAAGMHTDARCDAGGKDGDTLLDAQWLQPLRSP